MSGSIHQEAARARSTAAEAHHRVYAAGYAAGTNDRDARTRLTDPAEPCSAKERGSWLYLNAYREALVNEPPSGPVQLVLPLFQPTPTYLIWKEAQP